MLLRVNSFGEVANPGEEALGLLTAPTGCPDCRPAVDVDPPGDLLPGEWPLPPFLSPGVPEERHDHHLRAHLARTQPSRTVSDDVAALGTEELDVEAFTLLTRPDAWKTSRDNGRRHLEPAVRRHRELTGDPHLAHEAAERTEAFRDALTGWQDATRSLRDTASAAGGHLALRGFDVLALRDASLALQRIRAEDPGPELALRLLRMVSLGFTGEELLQMHATGSYPDEETIEFLGVLRG